MIIVAGPCQVESYDHALRMASLVSRVGDRLGIEIVFKASFDKANRTSRLSPRGAGIDVAKRAFAAITAQYAMDCLTDIHEPWQAKVIAQSASHLQIPALLCRQTDLIEAAARTGRVVNIKKGQGVAPSAMLHAAEKARAAGAETIWLTERGTTFGYGDLVVDMRGFARMRGRNPVLFDASHSTQSPSGLGASSGGERDMMPTLARAAIAAGADGIFVETHDDPDHALSDGPVAWPVDRLYEFLAPLRDLHAFLHGL